MIREKSPITRETGIHPGKHGMARKSKAKKKSAATVEKLLNLPTAERVRHGGIVVRGNIAHAEDPLRIDKLLKNGIIDEMQHLYGMQITTLWTIANRPFLKAAQYEPRHLMRLPDIAMINISRMSAEDKFHKAMGFLRPRDHELVCRICFKEEAAIAAGRAMGLAVNSITTYVRAAFDALGDALARMRDHNRDIERREQAQSEPAE